MYWFIGGESFLFIEEMYYFEGQNKTMEYA